MDSGEAAKFIDLHNRLGKLKKALKKTYTPILKNFGTQFFFKKPLSDYRTDLLDDPNNSYWIEEGKAQHLKPYEVFNKVLSKKYSLTDKNFDQEMDNIILKGVEEDKTWLKIGLNIEKHPFLCLKRYIKLQNATKTYWTKEEDKLLLKSVTKNVTTNWETISLTLPNKTKIQCRDRYKKINKNFKKGKWTKEEDDLLKETYDKYSDKGWAFIATFIPLRSDVQCRERWTNSLNPKLKRGKWSSDEDDLLLRISEKYNFKWTKISERLKTRTDAQCRRRYLLLVKRKIQ